MLYDVYVQGKFYKSVEAPNSMDVVWKITNDRTVKDKEWYDHKKPANIKVVPSSS